MPNDNNSNNVTINGNAVGNFNIGSGKQTVKGNVTVTMGDMTQSLNAIPPAFEAEKEQLKLLMEKLTAELASVSAENAKDATKVANRTRELIEEVSADEVDAEAVESKADLLKKAAENVRSVLPIVFQIAGQIVVNALKITA